jgi:nucleotide-binding universal stress UspA family protein
MTSVEEIQTPIKTLVAAIDFSQPSTRALAEALRLAAERPHATLHIVYVGGGVGSEIQVDLPSGTAAMTVEHACEHIQTYVEKARVHAMLEGEPIESDRVVIHVRVGTPTEEIVDLAKDTSADLIVVGTHGRTGIKRLLLGSVAEAVVERAGCAVLVVRAKDYESSEA